MRCACALSPARFVLVCDACARSSVHTLGHNSWQPGGDRGRAHQCDPGHIHTLRGSEGGHPCARREVIHALQGRPSTRSRKVIHALQGRRSTRRSTRSEGGYPCAPWEVSTRTEGVDHRAKGRKVTTRFRGDHSCAPREAIHVIKGGHPRARGRPSTRSKGSSTRSKGGAACVSASASKAKSSVLSQLSGLENVVFNDFINDELYAHDTFRVLMTMS